VKQDLNNKRIPRKYQNTWKLNNIMLKIQWMIKVIREEFRKFLESNENENTIYQNLWDTTKDMLRGKFRAVSAYIKKKNRDLTNKQSNNAP
jgi:hypothetical protein